MYYTMTVTFKAEDIETVNAVENVVHSTLPFIVDNVDVSIQES